MPRRKDKMTDSISAIFGNKVLVEQKGKKLMVTKIEPRRRKKTSPVQKIREGKFREAVRYAKHVNETPKLKAAYKRKLKGRRNVFQAVLSDYLKETKKVK